MKVRVNFWTVLVVVGIVCICVSPDLLAQGKNIGDIMKENVGEATKGVGEGWLKVVSAIGWIMTPLGLIGLVGAFKDGRGEWKGPAAALIIGSLALAVVYIPGIITQTVLKEDADGLGELGVGGEGE